MVRKTAITILGVGNSEILSKIYEEVKAYIHPLAARECKYTGHGNLKVVLDEPSPAYQYVLHTCQLHHLHPFIAQWVHYSKKEIEQSAFFDLLLPDPLELEGTDASDYGTQYIGGCPNCGLGSKPAGEYLMDRKFLRKYCIGHLRPEIFVSREMKDLIQENRFTGVSFPQKIMDFKGRDIPEYYIMDITHTLPPMSDSSWLWQTEYPYRGYEACGHQILYLRSDMQYEKEKLEDACDFNLSCEYVNNFRQQKIVISSRVRKIFKENKIKANYFPVALL